MVQSWFSQKDKWTTCFLGGSPNEARGSKTAMPKRHVGFLGKEILLEFQNVDFSTPAYLIFVNATVIIEMCMLSVCIRNLKNTRGWHKGRV